MTWEKSTLTQEAEIKQWSAGESLREACRLRKEEGSGVFGSPGVLLDQNSSHKAPAPSDCSVNQTSGEIRTKNRKEGPGELSLKLHVAKIQTHRQAYYDPKKLKGTSICRKSLMIREGGKKHGLRKKRKNEVAMVLGGSMSHSSCLKTASSGADFNKSVEG